MKILVLCDQGNNRSVTIAQRLKYVNGGNDCISAGLATNSPETLRMLCDWAELIITTESTQVLPERYRSKHSLWNVGPDKYPRPFNKDLLKIVNQLINQHRSELDSNNGYGSI